MAGDKRPLEPAPARHPARVGELGRPPGRRDAGGPGRGRSGGAGSGHAKGGAGRAKHGTGHGPAAKQAGGTAGKVAAAAGRGAHALGDAAHRHVQGTHGGSPEPAGAEPESHHLARRAAHRAKQATWLALRAIAWAYGIDLDKIVLIVRLALAALAIVVLLVVVVVLAVIAHGKLGEVGGDAVCGVSTSLERVVPNLVPIYVEAATRYKLGEQGPAILGAINQVETDFGRNLSTSSAGAIGWMQFMPGTWWQYGVDADGDGIANPYSPRDAIHGTANYLRASGAPRDWHKAIFAYNHAEWYVDNVLGLARGFQGACAATSTAGPVAERAVQWALSQVGTVEQPSGSNCGPKVREWQQGTGMPVCRGGLSPWCGAFVHAAYAQAGVRLNGGVAGTWNILAWARAGREHLRVVEPTQIRRGDLVLFAFNGGGVEHVGIATRDYDGSGSILSVDGNTTRGGAIAVPAGAPQGEGVWQKRRPLGMVVAGARIVS